MAVVVVTGTEGDGPGSRVEAVAAVAGRTAVGNYKWEYYLRLNMDIFALKKRFF
jgi:hypothetical protein